MYNKATKGDGVVSTTGKILKHLRELKQVSMDEMVSQLKTYGVSPSKSMISRWESGKAEPSMEYARLLARYFNVSLDYLLGIDEGHNIEIKSIAAHAIDDLDEEQIKKVIEFAKFIKSQDQK